MNPSILVLKDQDPVAKRRWLTIAATTLAFRFKIPGNLFGHPRISGYGTRLPDVASRIPLLDSNHVTDPIVLVRKSPNLLIER